MRAKIYFGVVLEVTRIFYFLCLVKHSAQVAPEEVSSLLCGYCAALEGKSYDLGGGNCGK